MKKIIPALVLCFLSVSAVAKKTTYIYTNNRFNFVKIEEMSKKESESLAPTHPFTFTVDQLRAILKEVKLSRSFVISKEVETQDIFDERAVEFLAPKLVEAFAKAGADERVVFSYLTKDSKFFMRNDRLTIAYAWVHGSELHIEFEKMMAKLTGDYDKRGDFTKIVSRARGLRVSLDVRDGQMLGESSAKELVIDTSHDFSQSANAAAENAETAEIPPSPPLKKGGDSLSSPPLKKGGQGGFEPVESKPTANDQRPTTSADRLKELESLKDDGLITEKEYKQKRKEILKGL